MLEGLQLLRAPHQAHLVLLHLQHPSKVPWPAREQCAVSAITPAVSDFYNVLSTKYTKSLPRFTGTFWFAPSCGVQ